MQEHQGKDSQSPRNVSRNPYDAPATSTEPAKPKAAANVNRQAWAPLTIPAYRTFWIAGLFSNMGTWMHETGAQWLMTSLEPSPDMVSAVRTAMTIPVFCLALPAGVWADRFDRRTWLVASQLLLLGIAGLMALLAALGMITPMLLLILTACMGIGMVLNQPAWQALTPELVPPAMVPAAVAIGSVSFNLARSLGPVLAGVIIAQLGVWATFSLNALSFLAVVAALLLWNPQIEPSPTRSPPEFMSELKKGVFVVSNSVPLRNTLLRVLVFAISASILWSLLSLVATEQLGFRERGFGACLGLIGAGAVVAAWFLPRARIRYSSEAILMAGQFSYAGVLLLIGFGASAWALLPALLLIGACWMSTMTTLNATAQVNLPRKFRARGMAAYLMAFALGMAIGSFVWGELAQRLGLDVAFVAAAVVMILTAILMHPLKIGSLHLD
jgi:predicted MFS family arabinose efflux permease